MVGRDQVRSLARIEILACEAWASLGHGAGGGRSGDPRARRRHRRRVDEIERVTNHDVAAFVQAAGESMGEAGRWIHFGLTSSDLLDTALALQMRDAADLLLGRVEPCWAW